MGRKKSKGTRGKVGTTVTSRNARGASAGPATSADIVPAWCRTFMANSWEAIGIFDLEENVVLVNERFAQELGYTQAELVGKNLGGFCERDVYDKFRLESELRRDGRSSEYEVTLIRKDGQRRTFVASASPFRGEDGAVIGAIGMMADVTERKRAEERLRHAYDDLEKRVKERTAELATANEEIRAEVEERKAAEKGLRKSEERYRQLFNSANDALYLFAMTEEGLPGDFVDVNDAACRALGYTREELLALSPLDIQTPEAAKEIPKLARRIMKEGGLVFETVNVTKEGRVFPVEISIHVFELGSERTGLAIARDITERKRAEEELRQSRDFLDRLVNGMSETLVVVDRDYKIKEVNNRFVELYGGSREEVLGRTCYEVTHKRSAPCRGPEHTCPIEAIFSTGEPFRTEHIHKDRDGCERLVEIYASPILTAEGEIEAVVELTQDITERKQNEEALRRRTHDLGERVKELNCLYGVSKLVEDPAVSLEEVIQGTVELIPPSWQYPEITCARAVVDGREFTTAKYRPGDVVAKQAADIRVSGETVGAIEVCYVEEKPEQYEGPFHKEERMLIDAVAERLGKTIEHGEAEGALRRARDELELRVEERTAELTETLEKLRASEETYRKLVETLPGGVSTTNFDGEITYASPQSAALHGFDRAEDLVGTKFFELLAPEVRAKAAEEFQKAVEEGGVRNLEITFLRKDGVRCSGEVSATLMKDADGKPTGFVATTRDITDRKRAEEAVRESEEKYRTLVEQARDGITIVQEGRLAFANGAFAEMVGYAGDELAGKEFLTVVPPRLHKEVADQYERYEPGAEPARAYETCLLTRDGREVPVAATASQIQYGGRPAHLVFVYDLTERREQEKVVREQKWVLENVLNNMGELVYVLDPNTYEILFTNETTEAALGKGLAGQPCYRAIWGLEVPCHGCDIVRVFAGDGEDTYTREAFNEKLGRWLRVNVRAVPWLNGGQVCCAVAADISESKALEEEIIAHNRALNRMVKERTAALEAKNRELESFAYSVSHDLRAPLRSVEGFSRAVLDDYREKLDEDGRDFLERIVGAAVRMDQLINDLLNYSQLGRSGVDYEVVDMNELVAVALEDLDESIKAAGARVEVAGPLPRVNGDRSMLLVLLNNLVGNAIKYRKADVTPEVKISCRGEGEKVVFAVEDNGIGLDMKFQYKVFEIFQRLHTEDEYPGTGIGLASAKKVVTAHGGRIWYESKPGGGTTFFFEVPAERGEGDNYGG